MADWGDTLKSLWYSITEKAPADAVTRMSSLSSKFEIRYIVILLLERNDIGAEMPFIP